MKKIIALTGLVVAILLFATDGHFTLGLYFAVGLTLLLGLLEPLTVK